MVTPARPTPGTEASVALQNPLFRALWIASVASSVGSNMHDTAAVWTMTTLTSSATMVTLMQTMSSLPLFLLALPAGALADILDRRRVILVAQLSALAITLVLVALAWGGQLSAGTLLISTFALGVTTAFTLPTWQAVIAEIVPQEHLSSAVTLGSVGVNIARAMGPLIGGILLAASGPAVVFICNALSFLGIVVVLLRWRRAAPVGSAHAERMLGAMTTALRFTRNSPLVRSVLIRTGAFGCFGIATVALLPLLVRHRQLAASDFGVWMGAYGVGGIVAAFVLLPALRSRFSSNRILTGATLLFAGLTSALTLVEDRWAIGVVLLLSGAAWLTALSTLAVAGQRAFPNWVRARSSALALLVLQGALAAGALIWGQVAAYFDPIMAFRIAAVGLLCSPSKATWRMTLRRRHIGTSTRLPLSPRTMRGRC
jgi:MFS family permease